MGIHEETQRAIQEILRGQIAANARIDAIGSALGLIAAKSGIPRAELASLLSRFEAAALSLRLEKLETSNPALSAELDQRPLPPEVDPDAPPRHP